MVFDVTRKVTYQHLSDWYKELREHCENIPCVLVANKIDVDYNVREHAARGGRIVVPRRSTCGNFRALFCFVLTSQHRSGDKKGVQVRRQAQPAVLLRVRSRRHQHC
jgi:GTPase SAR1 family protein